MSKEVNQELKKLKRKFLFMIISAILLLSAVFYYAYGWYTKNSSMSDVTFDVAKWEFSAAHQTDDTEVTVYTYTTLQDDKAAPGAWGSIDYLISASGSQSSTDYAITFDKSSMLEQFQKRMHFYYKTADGTGELADNDNPYAVLTELTSTNSISGQINKGDDKIVHAYWHWIYDYNEYLSYDENAYDFITTECGITGSTYTDDVCRKMCELFEDVKDRNFASETAYQSFLGEKYSNATADEKAAYDLIYSNYDAINQNYVANDTAFNEFDADVGKHPDAYAEYMKAVITTVGVETQPVKYTGSEWVKVVK